MSLCLEPTISKKRKTIPVLKLILVLALLFGTCQPAFSHEMTKTHFKSIPKPIGMVESSPDGHIHGRVPSTGQYLISHGIALKRTMVKGYGESTLSNNCGYSWTDDFDYLETKCPSDQRNNALFAYLQKNKHIFKFDPIPTSITLRESYKCHSQHYIREPGHVKTNDRVKRNTKRLLQLYDHL